MLISHGDREMKISNRKFIQRTVFDIIISAALRIQMHPAKIDRAGQNLKTIDEKEKNVPEI